MSIYPGINTNTNDRLRLCQKQVMDVDVLGTSPVGLPSHWAWQPLLDVQGLVPRVRSI